MYSLSINGEADNSNLVNPECEQFISLNEYMPFLVRERQPDGSWIYSGTLYAMINEAAKRANFCYNVTRSGDLAVVQKTYPNTTASSMTGLVFNKTYSASLVPQTMLSTNLHLFKLCRGMEIANTDIAYAYPLIEPDFTAFIKIFVPTIWLLTGLFLVLTILIMVLTSVMQHSFKRKIKNTLTFYVDSAIIPLRIILCQDIPSTFHGGIQVFIVGFWLFFSLFIIMSYKSNLAATLTTPSLPIPFDNLEQLSQQTAMKWTARYGTVAYFIFKEAPKDSLNAIIGKGILHEKALSVITIINGIIAGKFAYIGPERPTAAASHSIWLKTKKCLIYKSRSKFFPKLVTLHLNKDKIELYNIFNKIISAFHESGIYFRLLDSKLYHSQNCQDMAISPPVVTRPLSLEDIYGMFMILCAGLSLSFLCFIVEIIVKSKSKTKQDKLFIYPEQSFDNTGKQSEKK